MSGAEEGRDFDSEELLSRFAHGDDSALGRLVEREAPWILQRIRTRLPAHLQRRLGASDILQLTAVDLMNVRERFENRGVPAFRKLIARIADQNLAKAARREQQLKRNVVREQHQRSASGSRELLSQIAASDRSPSDAVSRAERVVKLEQALLLLRDDEREIIELIDYDLVEYEEAARRFRITAAAARKRHSRAIEHLRSLMDGEGTNR